jgi:hypothetical protein
VVVAVSLLVPPTTAAGEEPTPAVADTGTVAVATLEVQGTLSDHLRTSLVESLNEGLARSSLHRVDDVAEAGLVLHARVTVTGPDYELGLELTRVADGSVVAAEARTCDLCGAEELRELAADLAAALGRTGAANVALATRLDVESVPSGARVVVDGELRGQTPLELELEPGVHEITVEHDGFVAKVHRLEFEEGVTKSLSVRLDEQARDHRGPLWRGLGWAGVGVGVGAMGAGTALIVLHDRPITRDCEGVNLDVDGDCKYVHKTLAGGVALVVGGALLLGTAVALLVVERRRGRKPRDATSWFSGPGGVGARF